MDPKENQFYKFILPDDGDLFQELSNSIDFIELGKGRKGQLLVNPTAEGIPIVRTTSKYNQPAHVFTADHHQVIEHVQAEVRNKESVQLPEIDFNNAMIEIYDRSYRKMKFHSDQCLDLAKDSWIALFSSYENPENLSEQFLRKLKVKSKITDEELVFNLDHNSVILFSLATNTEYLHKIVLDPVLGEKPLAEDNRWLGLTLRKSGTFIQFKDDQPYFLDGTPLTIADEKQQQAFYQLRGQENGEVDFAYPTIRYTLSESDRMMPRMK